MKTIHINIKKSLVLWCLGILILASCSEDETQDVFEDSPSERIDNRINELSQLLTSSSEGYKVIYFPKNDEFGGFTFYMKFNTDGTVDMTSDVNDNIAVTSSRYSIEVKSTVELVFSTRNHIHKLSDNLVSGLIGSGYKGNSNFQYIGNEDGKIFFKDARHDAELTFEPVATTDQWDNVAISLQKREELIPNATTSVFQQLIITDGSAVTRYNLNYDPLRLFANPRNQSADGTITELQFGIAFTTNGLVVSPAIEIDGSSFEEFIFDTVSKSFNAESNGVKASIGFADQPSFITDDLNDLGDSLNSFWYFRDFGSNPLTSPGFNNLLNSVDTELAVYGLVFSGVQLEFVPTATGFDVQVFMFTPDANGQNFVSSYTFTAKIEDQKLIMEYIGFGNPNGEFLQPQLQPLIDFFTGENGLFYETTGSFESDLFSYINIAGTLTSADDPSLRLYALWFN